MKKLEITEATGQLVEYVRNISDEALMLTDGGKPVAALVPIENADTEAVTLSTHPDFLALIERSRARQRTAGGITGAEMRRRLET
jgi:antitoxin (DNA-binding transcriptional repressor) of toxin-antitoxin stability system